jgi:hypothetical protein
MVRHCGVDGLEHLVEKVELMLYYMLSKFAFTGLGIRYRSKLSYSLYFFFIFVAGFEHRGLNIPREAKRI